MCSPGYAGASVVTIVVAAAVVREDLGVAVGLGVRLEDEGLRAEVGHRGGVGQFDEVVGLGGRAGERDLLEGALLVAHRVAAGVAAAREDQRAGDGKDSESCERLTRTVCHGGSYLSVSRACGC